MTHADVWPPRYKGDGSPPAGKQPVSRGDEVGRYLPDDDLVTAVNTALIVEQPLLVTGEPGTGKTTLAWSVASELGLGEVEEFHTRSDHQARDVLFIVDNLLRFYDAQTKNPDAIDPEKYIRYQALGRAIESGERRLVLIDEIDKAPRDFPNDLLDVIDQMQFVVPETGRKFSTTNRPVVVITSNSERELPDPFLRRCVFHRIEFPSKARLAEILEERLGPQQFSKPLADAAIARFEEIRGLPGIEKKPATGELLAWVRALRHAGARPDDLARAPLEKLPHLGAVIKTRHDMGLVRPVP